jgi:FkbM family methyltransferase
MKLDFDPRKNITKLDYFIMQLNRVNSRIKDLLVIKSIVNNWYDILLFRVGLKKPKFVMQLRNGKKIEIKKLEDYFSFWESYEGQQELLKRWGFDSLIKLDKNRKIIRFKFKNKIVGLYYDLQKQLANTIDMITGQFIKNEYGWLNVKGKTVIDIGANIGDTAIYFALKGAKHVYAFEPYPYSYGIATQNVRLNGLEDRITLLNEGCGKEKRKIKIDVSYKNFGGTDLKNFKNGTNINITTLGELVKRFDISSEAVLKIDCEGCEYGVLLNTENSNLRKFKQIQIEYHYGYLNLKKKLEDAGFNVSRKLPNFISNLEAENSEMLIGLLYANRV